MSSVSRNCSELDLPEHVAASIGELFFVEKTYSSCCSMWIPCVAVSAANLPTVRMKNICMNFYCNVSLILLYTFTSFSHLSSPQNFLTVCQTTRIWLSDGLLVGFC